MRGCSGPYFDDRSRVLLRELDVTNRAASRIVSLLANLGQRLLLGDVVARALDHLALRIQLEQLDVQVGQLRVHAREVLAQHALLVVEADGEQVAVLLELVELQLRLLELRASGPTPARPATPSPSARPRACSRGCTRCTCRRSVLAISAARCGLRSVTVMSASRESLSGLTAICPATARPSAVQVVVRARRRRRSRGRTAAPASRPSAGRRWSTG